MSQGCTTITYNGITLLNTQTRSFSQDAVFDDSGTDLLYHRFVIRVVGYIVNMSGYAQGNPLVTAIGAAGNATTKQPNMTFSPSASYNFVQVRHKLQEQRRQFAMAFGCNGDGSGGTIGLSASPASDLNRPTPQDPLSPGTALGQPAGLPYLGPNGNILDVDVNNGPKSKVIGITHVSADEVLKCEVEFEICKLECVRNTYDAQSSQQTDLSPAVLSNRWTVNDSVDRNYLTTRTYTGRLRLASLGVDPNDFRSWVVPNVYPGFRRDSMSFTVAADGLTLDYTIIDKEIIAAAPAPATSWRFSHTESIGWDTNLTCVGECHMSLSGDRTVPRQLFIAMIAATFNAVMYPKDQNGNNLAGYITRELSFTDEVSTDGCVIHGNCRVERTPNTKDATGQEVVLTAQNVWQGTLAIPLNAINGFQAALNAIDLGNGTTYGDVYANYDPNLSRDSTSAENPQTPALFGPLSSATAFACYLQDPCNANHNVTNAYPGNGETIDDREEDTGEVGPQPTSTQITVVPTLPPLPTDQGLQNTPGYGPGDSLGEQYWYGGPYEHHRKEARIEQVPGSRIQLPLAPPANPQSQPSLVAPVPIGPQIQPSYPNPPSQGQPLPPVFPTPFYPFDPQMTGAPSNYGQQATCAFVGLFPPLYRRIVRIESSRVGVVPQIPVLADLLDLTGQTMNQMLLSWTVVPKATQYTSDGQPVYGMAAELVYGLDRPPSLASMPVGISEPWNNGGGNYGWTGPQLFAQDSVGDGTTQTEPA
jgi:hypothetical protein